MINFKLQIYYQNKKLQLVSIVTEIGIVLKSGWKMRKALWEFPKCQCFFFPCSLGKTQVGAQRKA